MNDFIPLTWTESTQFGYPHNPEHSKQSDGQKGPSDGKGKAFELCKYMARVKLTELCGHCRHGFRSIHILKKGEIF
jgi:hypothetical protein